MAILKTIIFKLNEESFGLEISKVSAIEKQQEIVTVPNSSKNIKGIINLRGDIIPVIDLKAKFNMNAIELTDEAKLVVVNLGKLNIAIMVDSVSEICDVNAEDIVDMPVIAKNNDGQYLSKVAKIGKKLVIYIDPEKLLSNDETKIAEKLVDDSAK